MNLQHVSHPVGGIRTAFGRLRSIAPCERGHTMVEFAIIGPVFLALLLSILEFSGVMFVQTLLEGGAREASRYGITGAIPEGISRAQMIRQIVEENTFGLVETEDLYMETLVYDSFSAVGEPEPFTDENGNGTYDVGEPFTDINGNGGWDDDMGASGLGGPGDVVVYRMSYDWPIMIPLFRPFFGDSVTLRANIAVRNEPFGAGPGA